MIGHLGDEEGRLLDHINKLAAQLQQQRLHPVKDMEKQRQVMTKLQQDLAACWTRVRAERAAPGPQRPDIQRRPHGRNWSE